MLQLALIAVLTAVVAFVALVVARTLAANKANIEGTVLLAEGKAAAALEQYERASRLAPQSPIARLNLATALVCLWRFDEANALLGQGAPIPEAAPVVAFAAAMAGRKEVAILTLKKLGAPASPHASLAECVLACRAGDWASAEKLLGRPELAGLAGFFRAVAEALRAWTASKLGREPVPFERTALSGDAGPGAVRRAWPELADFTEKQG